MTHREVRPRLVEGEVQSDASFAAASFAADEAAAAAAVSLVDEADIATAVRLGQDIDRQRRTRRVDVDWLRVRHRRPRTKRDGRGRTHPLVRDLEREERREVSETRSSAVSNE